MKQFATSTTHYFFFLSLSLSFFSFFLSSLFLGLSLFLSIFIKRGKGITTDEKWFFALLTFPFLVTLISGIQSTYLNNAIILLTRITPLLLCPLILFKQRDLDQRSLSFFKIVITAPIVFIALEGLIRGIVFYVDVGLFFPAYSFEHLFRIQHTYLVLYLLFCCILWFFVKPKPNKTEKATAYFLAGITLIVIIVVKARFGVLYLLAMALWIILKQRKLQPAIIPTLIIITILLFTSDKFLTIFSGNESRVMFWQCAISLVDLNVLIRGIPVGDLQELLNSCYYAETMQLGFEEKNTHNQFLSIFMTGGIFALLTYLFLIIKVFIHQNKSVFRMSLLLFLTMALTENIFERQHGILFICIAVGTTYYLNNYENNRNRHWLCRSGDRNMPS